MLASLALVVIAIISGYTLKQKELNFETLAFQLTMPGLDEEILFRGVLLGLLLTILSDKSAIGKFNFGNPSLLIISILFGLVHGLGFEHDQQIYFHFFNIFSTGLTGYGLGWIAINSRSILLPAVTHNLFNFLLNFISMI
ncbi:CPBP family intramembrane glutamic endopeptidase [Pontibacter arcticus]|uniref:CPBP family intramembrane glutamic endopeptidase n=1 Tax=Pontibacter arcticus TaxID=2080288 RepID=UPI000F617DDD|nr:CPBP family intramembrane glutamic endopeptidase [Pontibacter arcticus]